MKRTVLAITFALIVPAAAPPASAQGTWVTKAPLPTLRSGFPSAALNGLLYAIGGQTPAPTAVVEVYNPATDSWATVAPLPVPIQRASAAAVNGLLYVVGGCADEACSSLLNTVYAYDPSANAWTSRAAIPTPRRDPNFLAVVNGIIYAAGGGQGPGCSAINSLEAYNPSSDTWTELAPMPVAQWTAAVAALSGKIYVAGGTQCSGQTFVPVTETDVYDPSTNMWSQAAPMPIAENGPQGSVLNGKLYVLDGDASGNCNSCTLVYDPSTDMWASNSPDPTARFGPQGDVINGSLYVVGGANLANTTILSTNETFIPPSSVTTTAVTSAPNPSVFGQSVTFTATVSPASGSGTPTGTVAFNDGGVTLGTGTLSGGQASFTTSSLSVGSHNITAAYGGDANFMGSTSAALMQTVNQASTTTALTSSPNPSVLNQSVTFTATVSVVAPGAGSPTGTVAFNDGGTTLATVVLSSAGTAAYTTSVLTVNSHSITAVYSGDGNFNGSSGSLTQNVEYSICVLYNQSRAVHGGATFPIKVALCDANGADVSSAAIVLHATAVTAISGFSGTPDSPGNANPDNDFRFDSTLGTAGGYIFNLSTGGLAPGTYSLQLAAGADPVLHAVMFGVAP